MIRTLLLSLIFALLLTPLPGFAKNEGDACSPSDPNPCENPTLACTRHDSGPWTCERVTCTPACGPGFDCILGECEARDTAATQGSNNGHLLNPLKADNLEGLIVIVMRGVRDIAMIFLVLALVFTGVLFVFAQGNEEKLKTARQALFWTVIGGLLVLSFQVILEVLKRTVENI